MDTVANIAGEGHLVIGADLNARHPEWGGNVTNKNGRILHEWLLTMPTIYLKRTNEPSRTTIVSKSHIDFFLVSPGLNVAPADGQQNGLRTLEYESDHRAVQLVVNTERLCEAERREVYDFHTMPKTF